MLRTQVLTSFQKSPLGTVDHFDAITNSCYFLYPFSEKNKDKLSDLLLEQEVLDSGHRRIFAIAFFSCLLACFGLLSIQGLIT